MPAWLNKRLGQVHGDTFHALKKSAHHPHPGSLCDLLRGTRELCRALEKQL